MILVFHSVTIHKPLGHKSEYGGVAHLGERLNGIQEVRGSIPLISTRKKRQSSKELCRFFNEINPIGFVKCAPRVKYACGV